MKKHKLSLTKLKVNSFETTSHAGRAKTQALAGGNSIVEHTVNCSFPQCNISGPVKCTTEAVSACLVCEAYPVSLPDVPQTTVTANAMVCVEEGFIGEDRPG